MGHEIKHLAIQKLNYLASGACRSVLLEGVEVKLSLQVCENDRFGCFCGCNGKTSTICHQ